MHFFPRLTVVLLHLLLTETATGCYFASTVEASNHYQSHEEFLAQCQTAVEDQVMFQLHSGQGVQQQSMLWARDTFSDLLANFKCHDKTIYSLAIDWQEAGRQELVELLGDCRLWCSQHNSVCGHDSGKEEEQR